MGQMRDVGGYGSGFPGSGCHLKGWYVMDGLAMGIEGGVP